MFIEHRTFRLRPEVTEADFLAADQAVQTEAAPFVPGFLRRTTARHDDGRWLVETMWAPWPGDPVPALDPAHDAVARLAALVEDEAVEVWTTID